MFNSSNRSIASTPPSILPSPTPSFLNQSATPTSILLTSNSSNANLNIPSIVASRSIRWRILVKSIYIEMILDGCPEADYEGLFSYLPIQPALFSDWMGRGDDDDVD